MIFIFLTLFPSSESTASLVMSTNDFVSTLAILLSLRRSRVNSENLNAS